MGVQINVDMECTMGLDQALVLGALLNSEGGLEVALQDTCHLAHIQAGPHNEEYPHPSVGALDALCKNHHLVAVVVPVPVAVVCLGPEVDHPRPHDRQVTAVCLRSAVTPLVVLVAVLIPSICIVVLGTVHLHKNRVSLQLQNQRREALLLNSGIKVDPQV